MKKLLLMLGIFFALLKNAQAIDEKEKEMFDRFINFTGTYEEDLHRFKQKPLVDLTEEEQKSVAGFSIERKINPQYIEKYEQDRTIFPVEKYLQKDTQTVAECSRGCNHRCLFCQRSRYHRYNVTRSLSNIIADLKKCVDLGFKSVFFTDLDFVRDIERAKQISTAILQAELPLKWACNMRADIIDEKEGIDLLKLMRNAGCYRVFVGLESSNNDILQDVNKGISQDYGIRLKNILDEIGLKMHASFLIGLPNDTPQKIAETVSYAKRINADMTSINALIPMPGTPYGDQPEKYGLIINQNDLLWFEKEEFMHNQVCGNKTMSAMELQQLHKKAYKDLLLP